jgi:hypothetical protein
VPARLHSFVQDTHDLDQAWSIHAVIQYVHRLSDFRLRIVGTRMPQMKAADFAPQLGTVPGRRTFRVRRHLAQRGRNNRRVAAPAIRSPALGACRKDLREIRPRQQRKTNARHANQRAPPLDAFVSPSR